MSESRDPFGRPTSNRGRLSDEETASRMLAAGSRMVNESGLQLSFDLMHLEEVIEEAQVSRSAVYRRWPTKAHYFADLLRELAGANHPATAAYSQDTIELAVTLALQSLDQLRTPEGRRCLVVEMCRRGAQRNFETIVESHGWHTYVAIQATLFSLPDDLQLQSDISDALRRSEEHFLQRMAGFYGTMAEISGYHLREANPPITFQTLATLGGAMVEGLALNAIPRAQMGQDVFEADPFGTGSLQEWTLSGLGFTSVIMSLMEPVAEPPLWGEDRLVMVRRKLEGLTDHT